MSIFRLMTLIFFKIALSGETWCHFENTQCC